ncbi:hypothetical protein LRQ04_00160 [Paenarthrobacter sp. AR 02]|uniref:hypothetical protein n=1 Tax=Paenarthrobacter sp. AR 02 TaxID=2899821 RepID=UPI001F16DD2F|nr:hypothetical protein [Paenarthrobacter sp. AR 02]MCF3137655.1 hypothetical protein [Paenarthrobacter sp. AR 02]
MAYIIYQGQNIAIPDNVKIDELADGLKAMQNNVACSWLTLNLAGAEPKRIRLIVGPGIPIGIVSDPMDGHAVDLSDDRLNDFLHSPAGDDV